MERQGALHLLRNRYPGLRLQGPRQIRDQGLQRGGPRQHRKALRLVRRTVLLLPACFRKELGWKGSRGCPRVPDVHDEHHHALPPHRPRRWKRRVLPRHGPRILPRQRGRGKSEAHHVHAGLPHLPSRAVLQRISVHYQGSKVRNPRERSVHGHGRRILFRLPGRNPRHPQRRGPFRNRSVPADLPRRKGMVRIFHHHLRPEEGNRTCRIPRARTDLRIRRKARTVPPVCRPTPRCPMDRLVTRRPSPPSSQHSLAST